MKVALLISTYNWPEALKVVLKSLSLQSKLPNEVLIADDGSGEATKQVIEDFQEKSGFHIQHIWQEDKGFRKSVILNKAIAASTADYMIQIDGDCIMHSDFIKDHVSQILEGSYLFGSRVNIKPGIVEEVLKMETPQFAIFSSAIKNKTRNLRIPLFMGSYKPTAEFSGKTRGCNISYWRKDLIAVNGYDETMEGWGREDSEFVLRMLNNGVKGKRIRYGGIVYHIYHREKSKDRLEENNRIEQSTIQQKKTWCEKGIDKYLTGSLK